MTDDELNTWVMRVMQEEFAWQTSRPGSEHNDGYRVPAIQGYPAQQGENANGTQG